MSEERPATDVAQHERYLGANASAAAMTPMGVMVHFLRQRKPLFFGNLALRLVKELLPFLSPILVGIAVDLLSGTNRSLLVYDLIVNDVRSIVIVAIAMGVLAIAKSAFGYVHTIVSAHLGRHVVETARREIAEASMEMALDERRRFNSGDLLDRSLADTKGLRTFTQNVIVRVITNTVRAIFPVIYMFTIDALMAVVVLAVIPLQSGFSGLLQRRLQTQTRVARASEAAHTSSVKEAIDGWSSVASVGGQSWVTDELQATARASEQAKIEKKHTTAKISMVINTCTALGIAACYGIGGWRIISSGAVGEDAVEGAFTIGLLVAFIGIAKKVYAPFRAYTKIVSSYRTGLVNLERIAEVLSAPVQDPRPNGPLLQIGQGTIDLENVTFAYDDASDPTINALSGTIEGRSLTVITGSSGAGKTTLLRLLMGLDVPKHGTIKIDSQDINTARLSSVRRAIALVPQEPMLFTGTLGENLTLGIPHGTTDQLLDACHKAGLLELVRELPKGLDTEVGSGRHMLSGGQLRRMAIARALLRQPSILLLDEPTSGLDQLHSEQVLDTLRRISAHTTVVMVSHRSGPLSQSDHHLILEDGTWRRGVAGLDPRLDTSQEHRRIAPPHLDPAPHSAASSANGHGTTKDTSSGQVPSVEASPASNNGLQASAANAAANGVAANGAAPSASDDIRSGWRIDHEVLGMSTMGRPIHSTSLDKPDAVARLMVVSGHRSRTLTCHGAVASVLSELSTDPSASIAMAIVEDLNPDAAHTNDNRTVLGIDPSGDHVMPRSTESLLFHKAIDGWCPDIIFDLAIAPEPAAESADVHIALRYGTETTAATAAWLNQIAQDIARRAQNSRFRFTMSATLAEPDSISAARALPVIEMTAHHLPQQLDTDRAAAALVEAAVAAYRSCGLSRPQVERAGAPA